MQSGDNSAAEVTEDERTTNTKAALKLCSDIKTIITAKASKGKQSQEQLLLWSQAVGMMAAPSVSVSCLEG